MPRDAPAPRFVEDYLLYLLARASHAASSGFHALLAEHGIGVGEWRVLATLAGSGGETVGALAEACLMKQPTMTRLLDRMERDGLVGRRTDREDGRVVRIVLTARGRAEAERLIGYARAHEEALLARHGGEAEAEAIKRLLRELIARHA